MKRVVGDPNSAMDPLSDTEVCRYVRYCDWASVADSDKDVRRRSDYSNTSRYLVRK